MKKFTEQQNFRLNNGIQLEVKKMKTDNRVYYITCKINGLKEEFRFKNKKVMQDYLANKGQILTLSNVSNVECYSQIEK